MAWVRYDDGFARHPKVIKAAKLIGGKFAKSRLLGLHLEATSYCNSHATDGFIADVVMDEELTSDPDARELLRICALPSIKLAHRVRGGYRLHDYHDYQPSKKEMEDSRAYEREKKRRQRSCPENVPQGHARSNDHVPSLSLHPSGPAVRPGPSDPIQDQDHRADARDSHSVLVRLGHDAYRDSPLDPKNALKDAAGKHGIPYDATAINAALDAVEHQRQLRAVES